MRTKDFLKQHNACSEGVKWALSVSEDMADVWDALVEKEKYDWLFWTVNSPGVLTDSILRKLACRCVRETPLSDGRKVWDLLTDERSRIAVEVAERYADGKATAQELDAAHAAAYAAAADAYAAYAAAAAYAAFADVYDAVRDAAADAVYFAAYDATAAAADAAVRDAARAAASSAADAATAAAYAADDAAYATARDAAKAAQVRMIAELGNPFKKERESNENQRLFETA